MLKCGDSMTKPHMLSLFPSSCLYTQLLELATVSKNFNKLFFQSHLQILFYTDKIQYIE